ncbi:MAG: AAA family ATPase [Spirosomaceae bacterium]|jgi:predicted ATPase|nr:AAA family ATPase [Spirosomataceae bacterium]
MKIELKNFGPIDHFEFDLDKDLHVIYGENNIGKSSIINAIYILTSSWKNIMALSNIEDEYLREKSESNIKDELSQNFRITVKELSNKYSNEPYPIIKIISEEVESYFGVSINFMENKHDFDIENHLYGGMKITKDAKSELSKVNQIFDFIYFFPASRSGMYRVMSSMGEILAKFSQYRNQLNINNLSIPSLTFPESEYFLNLSSINNNNRKSEYSRVVTKIEQELIGGEIYFDDSVKKLKYKSFDTGLDLELHETSSMIAEIAPIVAHLKYILPNSKSILFIEEPEAHLHPKIQVEMMRIYADLVNAGVKVVMTTHSDFMMNELTNLILERKLKPEKVASYHLVMGKNGSYDAGDMKATDEGIEDYNFTETIRKQYERRIELLEKLNEENAVVE